MTENVTITIENEILTASLFGEIDHHIAIRVRTKIDDELFLHLPKKLILDIGQVDFMDSSGLGLIMGRYVKTRELGVSFSVRGASPRSKKMLMMAGLEKIIEIEESEESNHEKNSDK